MLWSSVSIPGKPAVLMVDASRDAGGWEREFSYRLFTSMARRGLRLKGDAPAMPQHPEELAPHLEEQETFNCILLLGHSNEEGIPPEVGLGGYWDWLKSRHELRPKLLAVCTWDAHAPRTSQEILESPESFAPLALAPQSAMTARESGLYFLKFFTELGLHSEDSITGRMVWFSASKAKELLRRRRLAVKFGVRC